MLSVNNILYTHIGGDAWFEVCCNQLHRLEPLAKWIIQATSSAKKLPKHIICLKHLKTKFFLNIHRIPKCKACLRTIHFQGLYQFTRGYCLMIPRCKKLLMHLRTIPKVIWKACPLVCVSFNSCSMARRNGRG